MTRDERKLLEDVFLQPWFLPTKAAAAIRRMLPPEHRHRMKFYFDDYGCLKCEKRNVPYCGNGLCKACSQSVRLKLFLAIKRRWLAAKPPDMPRTFNRVSEAQRLLKDLVEQYPLSSRQWKALVKARVYRGCRPDRAESAKEGSSNGPQR